MSSIHVLHRGSRRYNLNDYTSMPATVNPSSFPLVAWWRSTDMNFSNNASISGSNKWYSTGTPTIYTASISTGGLTYVSNSIDSQPSAVGTGASTNFLTVISSINLTTSGNTFWTIAVVCYTNSDTFLLGNNASNIQVRKYRSSVNNISLYDGTTEIISNTFSSSISQPVVCWYQRDNSGNGNFYENKYARGINASWPTFNATINVIGEAAFLGSYLNGGISEICIWSVALSSTNISNLFDQYFNVRYPSVFYTH